MTNKQKSWMWTGIGFLSIVTGVFIVRLDPGSIWLNVLAMVLLLRVGFMIGHTYHDRSVSEDGEGK